MKECRRKSEKVTKQRISKSLLFDCMEWGWEYTADKHIEHGGNKTEVNYQYKQSFRCVGDVTKLNPDGTIQGKLDEYLLGEDLITSFQIKFPRNDLICIILTYWCTYHQNSLGFGSSERQLWSCTQQFLPCFREERALGGLDVACSQWWWQNLNNPPFKLWAISWSGISVLNKLDESRTQ